MCFVDTSQHVEKSSGKTLSPKLLQVPLVGIWMNGFLAPNLDTTLALVYKCM